MPKTRPPYSPGFRRQMVDLVRAGRDPEDLAKEFEPTAQSIRYWVAVADRQEGRRPEKADKLSVAEHNELLKVVSWTAIALIDPCRPTGSPDG